MIEIEKVIIKFIKSLDRIMDSWSKLTIRRTLLITYTILLLLQTITTTLVWLFGRDISDTWLGIMTIEYVAFGTMISWYFAERKRNGGE